MDASSLAALIASYVVAIVSAFASLTGTLGVIIPVVVPIAMDPLGLAVIRRHYIVNPLSNGNSSLLLNMAKERRPAVGCDHRVGHDGHLQAPARGLPPQR